MDFDRRVTEIIEGAEKALAGLASEAASARDYARAASLLAVAQRVADAANPAGAIRFATAPAPASQPDIQRSPANAYLRVAESGDFDDVVRQLEKKKGASTYPRFKREDDTLVKIGWSKSDKATYEHRSPRSVLDNLVHRIQEISGNGLRFTTDQLLPMVDETGTELPSYQCYLCLAWLVAEGLVDRHGRQGYTLDVPGDLGQAVDAKWQSLARR